MSRGAARRLSRLLAISGALLALAAAGCAERHAAGAPPSASTGKAAPSPSSLPALVAAASPAREPDALLPDAPPLPTKPGAGDAAWIEAVRLERWAEAETLLDALPESARARPEVRLSRARVAAARRDPARAVAFLDGLDVRLPALAQEIERWRAEAAAEAGPYDTAAAYFARSTKPRDLIRAAEAHEKAGDELLARRTADKAVAAAQRLKNKREEADARALRARLLEQAGMSLSAATDLRWVATTAPTGRLRLSAAGSLERLERPLSASERLALVGGLLDDGLGEEALAELERISQQSGAARAELLHARATALLKSRDYAAAARAFHQAAATRGPREPEQLFLSARALSRGGRDAEAIPRFREVVGRFGKTFWGDRAAYMVGRLLLQSGKFREAAGAHARYLEVFRRGDKREEAEYERALALLSSGGAKEAQRALGSLASRAKSDEAGKLRQLQGLAAMRAGRREEAVRIWADVVRDYPLSWAAQMARARLFAVGAPVPPLIEPAVSRIAPPMRVELPPAPAMLAAIGLDADAEAWLSANERAATAAFPGRETEALCAMYGLLSGAKRRYRLGLNAVSASTLSRAPSEAERWTWDCLYPRPYATSVASLEEEHDLPAGIVHAVMRQESMFDPAIVSSANAVGLMQLIPPTAKQVSAELHIPYEPALLTAAEANMKLGAYYFGKLLKTFRGSVALAAASYNAGPKAVSHWLEVGKDSPLDLWVARIPYEETRKYVAKVLGNHARYQWLAGGDAAVTPIPLELPEGARASADAY